MRIGINILYLIPGKVGGTETYARELIPHLAKDHQLVLFCGRDTAPTFTPSKNIEIVMLPINSKNRVARLLAEQTILPLFCKTHNIDVLFSLGYSAPFLHPCPSAVTIHDLNWFYHPEDFTPVSRFIWKVLTQLSAKFSNHVITDSQASAKSIHDVLTIDEKKIFPILHGTPATLEVVPRKPAHPYIFTVLADYPHKNLSSLLKAFDQISKSYKDIDLIICGLGKQPSSSSRIKYLGYVTRQELAELYAGAAVFVFPSSYEGFGYPVLEAMSYGTPVISSDAYSLSEVVKDGGILVAPYDVPAYVKSISQVSDNPSMRRDLIKKGYKRASELKWESTSKQTLQVLKKAVSNE